MEQGESVRESVTREFFEETGITLCAPQLKGIFTILIKEGNEVFSEWMMFTFVATEGQGVQHEHSDEGKLAWHTVEEIANLEMAPGDIHILQYMIHGKDLIYGTFTYSPDFQLLSYRLDSN